MSTHAEAAKMIRKELKNKFPRVKFLVRSKSFTGGDSVHVEWIDGPSSNEVSKVVNKYQYGSFDCMRDLYEYTNTREDIPQVKYVHVRREVSETIQEQVFQRLQKTHVYFNELFSMDECNDKLKEHWSVWTARDYIYRILVNQDLTNGYQIQN